MRQFTEDEKNFIMYNEDKLSLRKMAIKFQCHWKEVYACHDKITRSNEYREYIKRKNEGVRTWIKEAWDAKKMEQLGESKPSKKKFADKSGVALVRAIDRLRIFNRMWSNSNK